MTQGRDMSARDIASRRTVTFLRSIFCILGQSMNTGGLSGYIRYVRLHHQFPSQAGVFSFARAVSESGLLAQTSHLNIAISNFQPDAHLSMSNNSNPIHKLDERQAKHFPPNFCIQMRDQRRVIEEIMSNPSA
jgi:hypothetical protein